MSADEIKTENLLDAETREKLAGRCSGEGKSAGAFAEAPDDDFAADS